MNSMTGWLSLSVMGVLAVCCLVGCQEDESQPPPFTDTGAELTGVCYCSLAWGDYDGDGDLDIVLAGTRSRYEASLTTKLYRNNADGTFTDVGAALVGVMECSLAWGDYDGDGDLDLALAGTSGLGLTTKVYRNDGGGKFNEEAKAVLPGAGSCSLAWGDYDNDGDLDLAIAGLAGPASRLYRNDGDQGFAEVDVGLAGVSECSLAWGDCDSDGDLDLVLAGTVDCGVGNVTTLYENLGGGGFGEVDAGLVGVYRCSLALGDYDSTGSLDLALAGSWSAGCPVISALYRNDGGAFSSVDAGLAGSVVCGLAWGDVDCDGDLDLVITNGSISDVYRNERGQSFTRIDWGLPGVSRADVALGDCDGDGDLDVALAGTRRDGDYLVCVSKIYRNNTLSPNGAPPAPRAPTELSAAPGSGEVIFSWDAPSGGMTPALGLTYNLRVGTATSKDDVMPGMSIIGGENDGKRLLPAMGNVQHNTSWTLKLPSGKYYWSVQAVDTAFEGSPWAPEQTVAVP